MVLEGSGLIPSAVHPPPPPGKPEADLASKEENVKIQPEDSIGHIVRELADTIPYFEKHRIDYAWNGGATLREACDKAGVSIEEVMESLERIGAERTEEREEWKDMALAEVIARILEHHAYTHEKINKINGLLEDVVRAEGFKHPELLLLKNLFQEMGGELRSHMAREEEMIFPYLLQKENPVKSRPALPNPFLEMPFLRQPLRVLQWEHQMTGEEWAQIRLLTDGYAIKRNENPVMHALFSELMELEQDLHRHVHLENNVLFRRAIDKGWLE